jgi:hypothetical protein
LCHNALQSLTNPKLGLNELSRHARQFENARVKGKRAKEFVRSRHMLVPPVKELQMNPASINQHDPGQTYGEVTTPPTRSATFCHLC